MSHEPRLDELEVRLSFVDEAVQGLASADIEQSQRLAALERAVRELRAELASVRSSAPSDPHSEPPPPHY
ncbi:SlyX family protein [Pinirhizobacter soli]|jgi:SlyX protein|uniref:SlyX family protein n=1 Tax=Pinirhizobacter soli TaxID=2786953 RepID=UPI00202A5268|nr:SlyX family protein [Pinirhizobacter soli]